MNFSFDALLNSSIPWTIEKVRLLNELVKFFYDNPSHPNVVQANQILTQLKQDTSTWLAVDVILKNAEDFRTKFFALQGLEELVLYKWKDMRNNEKDIIRNYIVEMVVGMGGNLGNQEYQQILKKANKILIQILKQEWATSAREFIIKICTMSNQDPNICENNFDILKTLSEEILDSYRNQMNALEVRALKETFQNEFGTIYQLCYVIIQSAAQSPQPVSLSLTRTCLNTFNAYLPWMPIALVFKSDVTDLLLQLFDMKDIQLLCLRILTEIISLPEIAELDKTGAEELKQKIVGIYSNLMEKLNNYMTPDTNLLAQRTQLMKIKDPSIGYFNSFTKYLTLFFSAFMKLHLSWIEYFLSSLNEADQSIFIDLIKRGFEYLVHLSELPGHTFRICIDFWNDLTGHLLKKNGNYHQLGQNFNLRESVYHPVVLQVSGTMITKMARPPEVIVIVDENGKIEDATNDSENSGLYDRMKELMSNLTILDWKEIKYVLASKLEEQLNKLPWNFRGLNSIYWTIGSINTHIENSANQGFIFEIINRLYELFAISQEQDKKVMSAVNFIYLVGQFSALFKTDWVHLESMTEKLFDFMSQASGGVSKMAAIAFLQMAKNCKEQYLVAPVTSSFKSEPYINQLLGKSASTIPSLQLNQRLIVYEAIGTILSAELNLEKKQYLIQAVLQEHWDFWDAILKEIQINLDVLKEEECVEKLFWIIKIHEVFASTICEDFFQSLTRIYWNMLKIYLLYSEILSKQLQADPNFFASHYIIKKIKNLRREVIVLITTYIEKCKDSEMIITNIIPSLNEVFEDYYGNDPQIREHEILLILVSTIEKSAGNVFQLTTDLIGYVYKVFLSESNIEANPVLLVNTLKLIATIFKNCLEEYLTYAKSSWSDSFTAEAEQLKFFLNCVLIGIKHNELTIHQTGLITLGLIVKTLPVNQSLANRFCREYYLIILGEMLNILINPNYKETFHEQSYVLHLLFQLMCGNYITVPLTDDQGLITNQQLVYQQTLAFFSKGTINIANQITELMNPQITNIEQIKAILRVILMESFRYDPMAKEEEQE